MPRIARRGDQAESKHKDALEDPAEIAKFYNRCSDLMRQLLDELANGPAQPRSFPEVERTLGWPRRRVASVLSGAWHLCMTEFGSRTPYHLLDEHGSASGRWEIWCDASQAGAIRSARKR